MKKRVWTILLAMFIVLVLGVNGVSAVNVTPDQVVNASENVNSYINTNHTLPSNTSVGGNQVDMPQYLKLSTEAVLNINAGSSASIPIGSYNPASTPSETITTTTMDKAGYLELASRVQSFMDTNGRAPNYASTSAGNIRYESLVYIYSGILNSYRINNVLPDYITVNPWTTVLSSDVIGSTSYGYVEKKLYGNQSSSQTVALIIGVHPQENGIHNAIFNALTSKSLDLTKRYVLYQVMVTKDANDYSKGRMNGQLLAQAFIVPDIASENPLLVLDNHENHGADSGYSYYRFLYIISNNDDTANYANQIKSQIPSLAIYSPPNPTSTQYVTVPIANQGLNTILYETYFYDSVSQKTSAANALIEALDGLIDPSIKPLVTIDPAGGTYYSPQNVVLKAIDDQNKNPTIYYTTDGSDPRTSSTRKQYTAPINISSSLTLNFYALYGSGQESAVYTEQYRVYKTVSYSYTVNVPYKKGWYKYWYQVSYKKWYKSWYKYQGKWRYKWKYKWAEKSKYKWKYGWIYREETRWGTKNVLT